MKGDKAYLLGADIGSSSCKAIIISLDGKTVSYGEAGYEAVTTQSGWAEQDPETWYGAFVDAVRQCLQKAGISLHKLAACSICGPAHNAVLLDKRDRILRPTILWWDNRSIPQSELLKERYGSFIFQTTFQPVHPSWTLAQLYWIRQNEPDVFTRINRIVIGKDYITYKLTGNWKTEWYDAMGTQLLDGNRHRWSEEICKIIGLDIGCLPPITDATDIAGTVTSRASGDTGLPEGLPVAVGSGDSVVEAFGVGAVECGDCLVKLATTGTVCIVTDRHYPSTKSMSYYHVIPNRYYVITATSSGASSVQWFHRTFQEGNSISADGETADSWSYDMMESLARQVPPGSDSLIFHPYLKGERSPYWDPDLRGDFIGISSRHTKGHFVRAVLEGVAFSLRDCMDLILDLGIGIKGATLVGGGARIALWRRIVCDVMGIDLRIPKIPAVFVAPFGASLLAGYAAGLYPGIEDIRSIYCGSDEVINPIDENTRQYSALYELYREITRNLMPIYKKMSKIYKGPGASPDRNNSKEPTV